jgi:crotonobetainyl-CoA:carnitine CoA-transferase CaiB-like acyl-CoA transferase
MADQAEKQGPLSGIRVLDLTGNISGPSATAILADLGADVIKIERPSGGDDARKMGPFLQGESAYFLAINRNKRSVAIDIRREEGQKLVRRLAGHVDVLVENFRRGVLAKYGLDAQTLCALHPRLIYCSLSAYGDDGPDAAKPGYDAVLQARTGIMSVTGSRAEEPVRAGVSILDAGSGMWSVIAILSALLHRERTGEGQKVGTSLFETGAYWMNYHLLAYQATGTDPVPLGASHAAFAPYGAYRTADDPLLIGISNDSLFARLAKALKHEEWIEDPRFRENSGRIAHRAELDAQIQACLASRPCRDWIQVLEEEGVPCSRIQRISQVMEDGQFCSLQMLVSVPHPTIPSVRVPRLPIRMEKSPSAVRTAAPSLGQHTREVLLEFGITEHELDDFRQKGVIA